MKEMELRKIADCAVCRKPFGHTGLPLFWRVRLKRYGIDMGAMRRQDGFTAMLGGNAVLANIMGADADIAKAIDECEITVCEACAMEPHLLGALMPEDRKPPNDREEG